MNKIIEKIKSINKKDIFGIAGIITLGLYFLICQRPLARKNKLQLDLNTLIEQPQYQHVIKIVITQSKHSKGEIRKYIIEILKKILRKNNITVLVNCSPQKLLKAGCQSFTENVQENSSKNIQYYYNALKTQLLVEKIILDVDNVFPKQNPLVIMICDNNCMDVKISSQIWRWDDFLKKYQIKQSLLRNKYHYVIHILSKEDQEDQKISQAWEEYENYHSIQPKSHRKDDQSVQESIKIIIQFLKKKLPPSFQWKQLNKEQLLNRE